MKRLFILAAGCLCATAPLAHSQIVYKVNGGTPALVPVNGVINVGTISTDTLIHIYDDTGVDENAPSIVIQGSATSSGRVRVQVVGPTIGDRFAVSSDIALSGEVALRDLGGIRFENPSNSNDTSLRDHSVVAVSIRGDITGDIDAGQVFRVDALQSESGTFGGTIAGSVRSWRADNAVIGNPTSNDIPSMAYVRAGRGILGDLEATHDADFFDSSGDFTYASIGKVVVGPATGTDGIQGNIKALKGKIGVVYTTGPIIGVEFTPGLFDQKQIIAGNGIVSAIAA